MYSNQTLFNKIGLPKHLTWAYLGILIFMMGDGIETGWLSPYLIGRGLTLEESALLFTVYGITIALSSWFSGVLAEVYGVKKTMFGGLVLYLLGTSGFVGLSLPELKYPLMLLTYALRGFGYPLFAYSFLVWIAYSVPKNGLGKAVGWFWFVFTGGLNVLGAYYSGWAIERIGNINTLWTSVVCALTGAFFALVMNKSEQHVAAVKNNVAVKIKELLKGIIAALYFIGAFLTKFITVTDKEIKQQVE
jgi:MFS family permease